MGAVDKLKEESDCRKNESKVWEAGNELVNDPMSLEAEFDYKENIAVIDALLKVEPIGQLKEETETLKENKKDSIAKKDWDEDPEFMKSKIGIFQVNDAIDALLKQEANDKLGEDSETMEDNEEEMAKENTFNDNPMLLETKNGISLLNDSIDALLKQKTNDKLGEGLETMEDNEEEVAKENAFNNDPTFTEPKIGTSLLNHSIDALLKQEAKDKLGGYSLPLEENKEELAKENVFDDDPMNIEPEIASSMLNNTIDEIIKEETVKILLEDTDTMEESKEEIAAENLLDEDLIFQSSLQIIADYQETIPVNGTIAELLKPKPITKSKENKGPKRENVEESKKDDRLVKDPKCSQSKVGRQEHITVGDALNALLDKEPIAIVKRDTCNSEQNNKEMTEENSLGSDLIQKKSSDEANKIQTSDETLKLKSTKDILLQLKQDKHSTNVHTDNLEEDPMFSRPKFESPICTFERLLPNINNEEHDDMLKGELEEVYKSIKKLKASFLEVEDLLYIFQEKITKRFEASVLKKLKNKSNIKKLRLFKLPAQQNSKKLKDENDNLLEDEFLEFGGKLVPLIQAHLPTLQDLSIHGMAVQNFELIDMSDITRVVLDGVTFRDLNFDMDLEELKIFEMYNIYPQHQSFSIDPMKLETSLRRCPRISKFICKNYDNPSYPKFRSKFYLPSCVDFSLIQCRRLEKLDLYIPRAEKLNLGGCNLSEFRLITTGHKDMKDFNTKQGFPGTKFQLSVIKGVFKDKIKKYIRTHPRVSKIEATEGWGELEDSDF